MAKLSKDDTATHKLVRIKPTNKRESHNAFGVIIKKADGWCRVPVATAALLAEERMNELNPEASPLVFDVMDEETAREVAEAENIKVEPAGTVDKPRERAPKTMKPEQPSSR
jgi:porphobilinogen deaminase